MYIHIYTYIHTFDMNIHVYIHTHSYMCMHIYVRYRYLQFSLHLFIYTCIYSVDRIYERMYEALDSSCDQGHQSEQHGVITLCVLPKNIGLFFQRVLHKRLIFFRKLQLVATPYQLEHLTYYSVSLQRMPTPGGSTGSGLEERQWFIAGARKRQGFSY